MQRQRTDVLVVGGGVIGLACALALRRAGRDVVVLDRGAIGGGASHGNCGTLTPSHAPPLAMPGVLGKALRWMFQPDAPLRIAPRLDLGLLAWLARFSRRCNPHHFAEVTRIKATLLRHSRQGIEALIAREGLDCGFEARGTLYVYRDARAFDEAAWLPRALAEVGIPIETWDAARARADQPVLNESIVGAHFNPDDAHLRPDRYVAELARVAREAGVALHDHAAVSGFRTGDGTVEATFAAGTEWQAREVVFAAGAWSPSLAPSLGVKLPIQPGKGYSITYARPAQCPTRPLVLRERSVCVTAWPDGYRLGSTMEFAGYDTTLNRTRLDALERGAREYLTDPVGPQRAEEWYGWRPMTWDDLPILGRSRKLRNLVLATGHGMLGVSLSAVTAELVAAVVTGAELPIDIQPLAVERFA